MIRVLVVEDSPVERDLLHYILSADPEIQVVGTASDGEEALRAVERFRPDVITMDIHMPRMDGFDATRRIMENLPTPIVIVSGIPNVTEQVTAFRAIEAGALAVLPRAMGIGHMEHEQDAADLVRTVKLMSEVKVVRRWGKHRPQEADAGARAAVELRPSSGSDAVAVIAIGASTGGPPVLQSILSALPADFSIPILMVQHIACGFSQGFAGWLEQSSRLPVVVASHLERILPGHIYMAPDEVHMKVSENGLLLLSRDPPEYGLRPSVSCLFRSVAAVYRERAVGVLLSGMGKDGAKELKLMQEQGAMTIAQDRETSVVHGMPGEAIRLGAATFVLSPEKIAATLVGLTGVGSSHVRIK